MLNGGSDTFYASHHYYKKIKVNKCRSHSSCFCKPSLMLLIWSMTGGEMKCRIKEYTHLNQQLLPVTKQLSSPLLTSGCWCLHMMNKRFLKRKLQRISVVAMISTICLEPRSQRGHRHKTREIWDIWEQTFLNVAGCGGSAQVQRSQCFRDDGSREQTTNGIAPYDLLRYSVTRQFGFQKYC